VTGTFAGLGWVDLALLGVLALSVVVGLVRGLVFEVLSVLGWVVAYFAAQWLSPEVAAFVPIGAAGSALNQGAAFAITFIAALILWGLAARLVRLLINATPLSLPDRVLGAGFGALRGVVVLLAVATVVALTPAVRAPAWRASYAAVWLDAMLQELKPVLPNEVAQHLPARAL
jgi:membrane protein required for colicin V production